MLLKKNNLIKLFLLIFLYFGFFQVSNAANLNLNPSVSSYTVGDTVTVRLYVSSPNQTINAVSANIIYSKDVLSLLSISKSSSIINLWAQEPNFSNTNGTAALEGIVLTGYTGSSGVVATFVFKAKSAGIAEIKFGSASVLANDGEGTNVLNNFSSAVVTVNSKIDTKPEVKVDTKTNTTTNTVKAPIIIDQNSKTDTVDKNQDNILKEIENPEITVTPIKQGFFDKINTFTGTILILLLILLIVLINLITKIISYRHDVKERVNDVKKFVNKSFSLLKEDEQIEVDMIKKFSKDKNLNQDDKEQIKRLSKDINDAEHLIDEKINDINKF